MVERWDAAAMDAGTLSSWIAAGISTSALGVTLWVRARDRATPDWSARRLTVATDSVRLMAQIQKAADGRDPRTGTLLHLTNDGDGPGFRVRVTCEQADSIVVISGHPDWPEKWQVDERVDRVAPGEGFAVMFWLKPGHNVENSALRIRWRRTPVRHRRDDETWFHLADPVPGARLGLLPAARDLLTRRRRRELTRPHDA